MAHLLDLDAFGVVIVHSVQRCFGNSVRHSTGGSRREGGYPKGNHDLSYALFRSVVNAVSIPTSPFLISGGGGPPAPPEEAGQVARLERLDEAALARRRGAEELQLDLGDGRRGGNQLVDVLLAARVPLKDPTHMTSHQKFMDF